MKTHILTLAAIAAITTLGFADSPESILKDYRARATQATQRLNETLEKQSAKIITDLIRKGDTAGAEAVTSQVKQKIAGEPLVAPHMATASLFAQYDGARATALQPVQKSSLNRLNSLLNVPGGPKPEDLAALAKTKAEIEAGKLGVAKVMAPEWTYHGSPTSTSNIAEVHFLSDGTMQMIEAGGTTTGKWKPNQKGNEVTIAINGEVWKMEITGEVATLDRPKVGRRYLKVKAAKS